MSKTQPAVGQVWQDNDPRVQPARFLRITAIEGDRAVCEAWYDRAGDQARTVRVKVSRFRPTSTGYRFLRDESGATS